MDTGLPSAVDTGLSGATLSVLGKRVAPQLTRNDTRAVDALVDLADREVAPSLANDRWNAFLPPRDSSGCNFGSAYFFSSPPLVAAQTVLYANATVYSPPQGVGVGDASQTVLYAKATVYSPPHAVYSPPHEVGVWEEFVKQDFVNQFISSQPSVSLEQEASMAVRLKVFDTTIDRNELRKLCVIENVFTELMHTPTQDTRLLSTGAGMQPIKNIIEVDELKHETSSGFLQPFRCFTVHDALTFNLIVREMQDKHSSFKSYNKNGSRSTNRPRTTKPTSEVLARIGFGPPYNVPPWYAYKIRGPPATDPKVIHPDDGKKSTGSERDGMYYTRYEYSFLRVQMQAKRNKHR